MASNFNLRAIISATDRLSPALRAQQRQLQSWRRSFADAGKSAIPIAAGFTAALYAPAKAFADLEGSAKVLQNALMDKDGLITGFKELNAITKELGKNLPGSTQDFNKMASSMITNGMTWKNLADGSLNAAAFLGVETKDTGGGFDVAADAVSRLGIAFKIADKDMVSFADTLLRSHDLGLGFDDMKYASSRVTGMLSGMKLQGLDVANSLFPAFALERQVGIMGEQIGTGLATLLSSVAGKHPKSIESIITNLQRLYKSHPKDVVQLFNDPKVYGPEHGPKLLVLAQAGEWQKMTERFKNQASINQRIANTTASLTNKVDTLSGSFTDTSGTLGEVYSPALKRLTVSMNSIIVNIGDFIANNKKLVKTCILAAGGFVGWKLAALGVAASFGFINNAFKILVGNSLLGKILLIGQMFATLAPIVYEHWGAITGFIKDTFNSAIDWILGKWESLKGIFYNLRELLPTSGNMNMSNSINSESRQRMINAASGRLNATLDINHNNAPQGFRAAPVKSQGPWRVEQNVGYRSFATGSVV